MGEACLAAHKVWIKPEIPDGKPTVYGWCVRHPENFVLAPNTDIGFGTYIQAEYGVTIEEGVQIGSNCSIYSISTINNVKGSICLKKNCKIGSHSLIMPGVTVGENAVVGAFSYVDFNVLPNRTYIPQQRFKVKVEVGKDET